MLSLLALGIAIATSSWCGAPGLLFYGWLGYVNFWFIAAFGISAFTTVVTEEKENGTLGLLKMAGFGAISILVGKSIGLVMPRGALAVALLVTYVGSMAISTILFRTNAGQGTRVFIGLILVALALGTHPAVFRLLRRRAGE